MFEWFTEPQEIKPEIVDVVEIDPFNAKDMRQVYGRGNYFGGGRTFQLDIWKNKNDQLFMRCWSHYSDYLPGSFSITGVNPESTRSWTANLTSEKNGFRKSSGTHTTIGPEKSFDLTSIEPNFSSMNLPGQLQHEPK